jgi:SAM-dependent methyltransferase
LGDNRRVRYLEEEVVMSDHAASSIEIPPRPPDFLIDRVVSGFDDASAEEGRSSFDKYGQQSLHDITTALAGIGAKVGDFAKILDFGCGCARVLRWLPQEAPASQIHGCDIDEQAIAWCQANLPAMTFATNGAEPPLPYADETFDLVLNHSVFTHIDERMQDLWLAELRRVLKPAGIALLSVHGPFAFGLTEHASRFEGDMATIMRREIERDGILYMTSDSYVGSSFPSYYHTTFHAPWYVFEHWSQWFSVRAYLPRADLSFQDIILLQRDDTEGAARPIAAAGARTEGAPPEPAQESTGSSMADVNSGRMPPVVGAALEHLGQRVTRLEAALSDRMGERRG